jgi:hydrogenase expression/formation protein HypD
VKFLDEYRAAEPARALLELIRRTVNRPWTLMEVCGGQTHSLMKFGIDRALPAEIELVHGPGCPVCVTPLETLDRAMAIAARPGVIFASFGDMLRVPGSRENLFQVRARGGDVRVVYSPLDAVNLAVLNPGRQVVFLAVGFETTAPTAAGAVLEADRRGLDNFSLLVSHVRVPPAMEAILASPGNRVQAFLAAGHVCTVMGYEEYHPLAARYHVPIVVTGFEPVDLLEGIWRAVSQLETGKAEVENRYARVVRPGGNPAARAAIETVFEVVDYPWRGIGPIPASGMALKGRYRRFDASARFPDSSVPTLESTECRSGDVLAGRLKPSACPAFGSRCTPDRPLGATMVSAEGACAAYYRYRPLQPAPISSIGSCA